MISAALLALATLSSPATVAPAAGYAPNSIRHLKGHASLPAPSPRQDRAAPAVCHPDPGKGRVCRHHITQRKAAHREALASATSVGMPAIPR